MMKSSSRMMNWRLYLLSVVDNISIHITPDALSIDVAYNSIQDPSCGGNALFIGTVRNHNKGKTVTHLDFESYREMALKTMDEIAQECLNLGAHKVAIHHREGQVNIGGIAVIIAISSPHRKVAFQACEYAIDQLKLRVPIWKKEFLEEGSYWVSDRP